MADYPISDTRKSTGLAGGFSFAMTAFSLVPEQLLDEENRDLWVNFLRERIPHNQSIAAEPFPLQHLVCLYEQSGDLPHAIPYLLHKAEALLVPHAPSAPQPSSQSDAPSAPQPSSQSDSPSTPLSQFLVAVRQEDRLALVCYKDGRLQLGNIYEAGTKEQTLYWILKVYEVLRVDMRAPLYIRCGDGTLRLLNTHLNTSRLE